MIGLNTTVYLRIAYGSEALYVKRITGIRRLLITQHTAFEVSDHYDH